MKLSHSKLSCILASPMEYNLNYIQGIKPKVTPKAFQIGTAVHWGLEHGTEDLTEYFKTECGCKEAYNYTPTQALAEAMVHGFLVRKTEIFDKILTSRDGTKLELKNEQHELWLEANLPSFKHPDLPHKFVGQIDLLLLTDKGFVLLDYKTSSMKPEWDKYIDQIYRYIFLLKTCYPDIPIVKIGIINLVKKTLKQKKGENDYSFLQRLKTEYDLNEDDSLIAYHEYDPLDLDQNLVDDYIHNLSNMADLADTIDQSKTFYINYENANHPYKSQYWDIYYHTPGAYNLYNIRDKVYDPSEDTIVNTRDCVPVDMDVIRTDKVMNKYDKFKNETIDYFSKNNDVSKVNLFNNIKSKYECDDNLLEQYFDTFDYDLNHPGLLDGLVNQKNK